jgi:Transposase, Mutator family
VRRTVPPSAEIEEQIDRLLAVGVGENPRESLSELAKLGARLIIQRAVEDEFDAWLGRARYERRPDYQRGLRNGFRPRKLQTAEGELRVEIPQVREAAEPFVSRLFPRGTKLLRTEPLRAMVIGAFVRGLSMRDVESLWRPPGCAAAEPRGARRAARRWPSSSPWPTIACSRCRRGARRSALRARSHGRDMPCRVNPVSRRSALGRGEALESPCRRAWGRARCRGVRPGGWVFPSVAARACG